ncbi:GAF and ANTAR domain-containing protein [Mycobacterium riyadhense]|uniref:Response regulator receiver protein n=1 Tax=Mycobacterium riyadhense TaxID=486698 RepID=A0A1X2BBT1_9MYCO|nr:GAF and ANTAR domain-containing protein [Mycobacterium riyadhense]MCV7145813.1 GAF and ANTAR domain-containing protein [Mycobacterium riyadhense]ORW61110.1 response regulator receiver protein [Mycobacterium riyadhense]VTP04646.1 ANTAR domain protein [Mycobacterium riyadhense]
MTASHVRAIALQVAELARNLQEQQPTDDIDTTLGNLLDTAVKSVPGAEHAALTMGSRDGVRTVSATAGYPILLGKIQQRHKDMCGAATWEGQVIRIDDVTTEQRWPGYCRDVADETPIRSIMTIPLFVNRHNMGALNFYASRRHAFDAESVEMALIMATHAALAWSMLRHDQQFRSALASRDLIGQAKGMLMERFNVDAVRAFALLSQLSQNSNTAVVEIARRLIEAKHARR